MSAPQEQTLRVVQGNTYTIVFLVKLDGQPRDLTNCTVALVIKNDREDDAALVTYAGTVTDAVGGKVAVLITTVATGTAGRKWHRLDVTEAGEVRTHRLGPFEVVPA